MLTVLFKLTAEAWFIMKFLLVNHIILVFHKCTWFLQNPFNPEFALLSINSMWRSWKGVQYCTELYLFPKYTQQRQPCWQRSIVWAVRMSFSFGRFSLIRWVIVVCIAKNTHDCGFSCCLKLLTEIWVVIRQEHSLAPYFKRVECWTLTHLREVKSLPLWSMYAFRDKSGKAMQPKCQVKI